MPRGLTKQQLQEFLMSNPNASFEAVSPNGQIQTFAPPKQQKGLLGKLISGFTDPLNRLGGKLGNIADRQNGITSNRFMSAEDEEAYKNPWNVIKDVASAGSAFIPFGAGVKGALAAGALSGFGGSYGQDSLEDTLKGSLTGAAGGFAMNKGLGLLGKAAGGLKGKFASPMLDEAGNAITKSSVGGLRGRLADSLNNFADNQEIGAVASGLGFKPSVSDGGSGVLKLIKDMGIDYSNPTTIREGAEGILNANSGLIRNAAGDITKKGLAGGMEQDILATLDDRIAKSASQLEATPLLQARQAFIDDLDRLKTMNGDTFMPGADNIFDLKQVYGQKGKWNPMSPAADVDAAKGFEALYGASNEALEKRLSQGGFNEFRDVNKKLSNAMSIRDLAKKAELRDVPSRPVTLVDATAGIAGGLAGGPVGAAAAFLGKKALNSEKAQTLLTKGARGLAGKLESGSFSIPGGAGLMNAASKAGTALAPVAKVAGTVARNPRTQGIVGSQLLRERLLGVPGFEDVQEDSMGSGSTGGMPMGPRIDPEIVGMRQNLAQQLMSQTDKNGKPLYTPIEALKNADAYLQMQGIDTSVFDKQKAEKLTESQQKFKFAADTARDALSLLESGKANTGKINNVTSKLTDFFGTTSEGNVDYRSRIALARTTLKNALLGASVSPQEASSLVAGLPSENDEPAVAKRKLNAFANILGRYYQQ